MFSASKSKGASGSYQIANSLRFRSSASAYLNRTPASAGNRQTWTWNAWVKRANVGTRGFLFSAGTNSGSAIDGIEFNTDSLRAFSYNGSFLFDVGTNAVFRDPSAWYMITFVFDSTQATSSDRVKLYVNSIQQTFSSATYPSQNSNSNFINTNTAHYFATGVLTNYFDGYLTEINFIDGQALTPSSFGETSSTTGVWVPKKYTGSYGTNGFYLNFSNGTSTTTLGNDSSPNGNNWTTNNISLTSGTTYDWMIDSPTSFAGSSYGVGNYAVINPLVQSANTYSNGNLTATMSASTPAKFVSSIGPSSGKWYMEFTLSALSNAPIGVSKDTTPRDYLGMSDGSTSVSFWPASASTPLYINGSSVAWSGSGTTWTTSDVAGLALDVDASTIALYKNGTLVGSAVSYSSYWTGTTYFAGGNYVSGIVYQANFGQRPFAYTPPSGFKSLCTQNLPVVTIYNGAQYMAATLYTGNGSTQSITNTVNGVGFQPDFVWVKARNQSYNHALIDSVRGIQYQLASSNTSAELTDANGITALSSSGFSVGTATAGYSVNTNATTYVGWQWKAGGTAVTNTAGSISSQVSANTTSGFAVVTYTGNGSAGATVGHGLGVAPSFIVTKTRSSVMDWYVYHVSLGVSQYLALNSTIAAGAATNYWGSSSTTFALSAGGNNVNGSTMVAYCFAAIAGYSAFGSYTGNGSADGPFVYCGFRPRYVLIKRTDTSDDWVALDTSRNAYNVAGNALYPNSSSSETNNGWYNIDFLSNGFKCRASNNPLNASSGVYIYAAFAENPFKNALAR